jgi:hypothetical protein
MVGFIYFEGVYVACAQVLGSRNALASRLVIGMTLPGYEGALSLATTEDTSASE